MKYISRMAQRDRIRRRMEREGVYHRRPGGNGRIGPVALEETWHMWEPHGAIEITRVGKPCTWYPSLEAALVKEIRGSPGRSLAAVFPRGPAGSSVSV